MGFLSDEQANERLELSSKAFNPVNILFHPSHQTGGGKAPKSEESRLILGTFGRIDGNNPTSKVFGVSHHTVQACSEGREKGINSEVKQEFLEKVETSARHFSERIRETASMKTLSALDKITDDKLKILGAKDNATIAASLSKVAANFAEQGNGNGVRVQFNIFRPRIKDEDEYEVIERLEG